MILIVIICIFFLSTDYHIFLCQSDLLSSRRVHRPYFGRHFADDDDDDDDDEDTDDVKSNTTDEEMDLVSYHLQALTKARFVKILTMNDDILLLLVLVLLPLLLWLLLLVLIVWVFCLAIFC